MGLDTLPAFGGKVLGRKNGVKVKIGGADADSSSGHTK